MRKLGKKKDNNEANDDKKCKESAMKIKEAKSLPQMIDDTRPILDAVNNAMTIADINGSIVYKNEAYNRMLKRGNVEFVSDRKTKDYWG